MKRDNLITAIDFCSIHDIEPSFLIILKNNGLIDLEFSGDDVFIPVNQIRELEKIITLHYDLDINLEGIETIMYLLKRSEELQNEINSLRNRLMFYEDQEFV